MAKSKRQPLGQTASSKRTATKRADPAVVEQILSEVKGDPESPVAQKKKVPARQKDEKYKLTAFISRDLFRRMKMRCAENDITIRQFLESAIGSQLSE